MFKSYRDLIVQYTGLTIALIVFIVMLFTQMHRILPSFFDKKTKIIPHHALEKLTLTQTSPTGEIILKLKADKANNKANPSRFTVYTPILDIFISTGIWHIQSETAQLDIGKKMMHFEGTSQATLQGDKQHGLNMSAKNLTLDYDKHTLSTQNQVNVKLNNDEIEAVGFKLDWKTQSITFDKQLKATRKQTS